MAESNLARALARLFFFFFFVSISQQSGITSERKNFVHENEIYPSLLSKELTASSERSELQVEKKNTFLLETHVTKLFVCKWENPTTHPLPLLSLCIGLCKLLMLNLIHFYCSSISMYVLLL